MNKFECFCFSLPIIEMSNLDETFRKFLPDIPFGVAITIQNKICMIHFKQNKISYREIWKTLSEKIYLWQKCYKFSEFSKKVELGLK